MNSQDFVDGGEQDWVDEFCAQYIRDAQTLRARALCTLVVIVVLVLAVLTGRP